MVDTGGLNSMLKDRLTLFQQAFPNVNITSGYRDAATNAAVGGARGSQHIHGNAVDLGLKGLSEDDQLKALQWWRDNGAQGFGYYPNSTSAHVDYGSPRAWGPNYSSSSLGQTPQFFQTFAANNSSGVGSGPTPGPYSGGAAVVNPAQPGAPATAPAAPPPTPAPSGLGDLNLGSGGLAGALGGVSGMAQKLMAQKPNPTPPSIQAPEAHAPDMQGGGLQGGALLGLLDANKKKLGLLKTASGATPGLLGGS